MNPEKSLCNVCPSKAECARGINPITDEQDLLNCRLFTEAQKPTILLQCAKACILGKSDSRFARSIEGVPILYASGNRRVAETLTATDVIINGPAGSAEIFVSSMGTRFIPFETKKGTEYGQIPVQVNSSEVCGNCTHWRRANLPPEKAEIIKEQIQPRRTIAGVLIGALSSLINLIRHKSKPNVSNALDVNKVVGDALLERTAPVGKCNLKDSKTDPNLGYTTANIFCTKFHSQTGASRFKAKSQ